MNEIISCRILRARLGHVPPNWRPMKRLKLSHHPYSSNSHESPNQYVSQPISLGEAMKNRYVAPFKLIYKKFKNYKSTKSQPEKRKDKITFQVHEEGKLPLPQKISDAWKLGLKGYHPSQFSRLRTKASTPGHDLKPVSSENSIISSSESAGHLGSSEFEPSKVKKSLLQSYLDLDKRSQKIISISVFVWSLSGVIYFTWFSPFESSIQTINSPKNSLHLNAANITK